VATFNNLDDLLIKVGKAYQCARVGSIPQPIELAFVEPIEIITTDVLNNVAAVSKEAQWVYSTAYAPNILISEMNVAGKNQ
jgi:hypothetical protein